MERGSKLAVVEQEVPGKCGTECRTVARACEGLLGDWDTDLAEALFAQSAEEGSSRVWLEQRLCRELTGACKSAPPPLPTPRR